MFSILVCSVNISYLESLKINIGETIGNNYEILVWDNLADPKPITEVYNLLAARAQFSYWCFIHEDIRFDTKNWSDILLETFTKHPETGLIGIAGSKYKSKTPSGWSTGLQELDYCNIWHQDKLHHTQHIYMNPLNSRVETVVNVDGVFMAVRRELWNDAQFNEQLLRGFHLYDIDFSFHVQKKWKAAVLFNIDIMHFTQGGSFGNEWLEYTLRWHKKYRDQLPMKTENFTSLKSPEKKIRIFWLRRLSTEKISWSNKWKWIRASNAWTDPFAWPFIGLFLLGKKPKRKVF